MELNKITEMIIGKSIELHRNFGPGLLESAYLECLYHDLKDSGMEVKKEVTLPIVYKNIYLERGYRMDLLVENKVVIELKSVETLNPVHEAQLLTYLKIGGFPMGLLINFHVKLLKDGIKRYVINQ